MKKENNQIKPMDERQSAITNKAIVFAYLFLVLCLFIVTIYKIVTTSEAGWELFAIIGSAAVILIARSIMGDVEQPLDYKNRPLPTGSSKPERIARIKHYAVGSFFFGLTFAVMDVLLMLFGVNEMTDMDLTEVIFPSLGKGTTIAVTAVITFVTMFIVSFIFDYLIGEFYKIKRYNKMIAELDEEDDEK
ncbi:MAG: hypothetical protein IKL21_05185 [Clostridia bacterium]|nr:hypothetical protein [Clostridia bacterium]